MKLAGLVERHHCESPTGIPDQWQRFAPYLGAIPGQVGKVAYGVIYNFDRESNLPAEQVFKTLVARGDRHGVCFAVVPGNCRLDLKALAKLTGDRKVETVQLKEVQPLTGYVRGGVTVPGAKKAYPVYVDEMMELFEVVSVSAGVRGLQILLTPAGYLRATGARLGPIATLE
jgi:Cys-tRNA(Pro)/Cys-tRNA(Cys) deacylase